MVPSRKGSDGGVLPTPGDKEWIGRGRGRGARDAAAAETRGSGSGEVTGRGIRGKWVIKGSREVREGPRPTPRTKREGGGLCRRRTESSSSRADAQVETQRKHGFRGSEGKMHAA